MKNTLKLICLAAVCGALLYVKGKYVLYPEYGRIIEKNASYTGITDSLPADNRVKKLTRLEKLSLETGRYTDLGFLEGFGSLQSLSVTCKDNARMDCSLDTLPPISSLKTLEINFYTRREQDFSSIGLSENIETLVLSRCNVTDFSFISELDGLKRLEVTLPPLVPFRGGINWSALGGTESLEEFSASVPEYDPLLLDALSKTPSLKRVRLVFPAGTLPGREDKEYLEQWERDMRDRGIDIKVNA